MSRQTAIPSFVWGLFCARSHANGSLLISYLAPGLAAVLPSLAVGSDLREHIFAEDFEKLIRPVSSEQVSVSAVVRLHFSGRGEPLPILLSGVWEKGVLWGVATPGDGKLSQQFARLQEWYGGFRDLLQSSNQQAYEWDLTAGTLTEAGYQSAFWRELMRTDLPARLEKSGLPSAENVYPADRHAFLQLHASVLAGGAGGTVELRMRTDYGAYRWCRLTLATLYSPQGKPVKAVGLLADMEYEKRAQLALLRRVSQDGLTGLYNGETFLDLLDGALLRSKGKSAALALISVDGYLSLVERIGWVEARGVLVRMASRLSQIVPKGALCARVAEDTFAVFCAASSLPAAFKSGAEMVNELRCTVAIGLQSERVTVSLGFSFLPKTGGEKAELLHRADVALAAARKSGDRAVCYRSEFAKQEGAGVRLGGLFAVGGDFDNNLLFTFFNRLYTGEDAAVAVREVLQLMGQHYHADRAYVYLADEEDAGRLLPEYEWVAPGVSPLGATSLKLVEGPIANAKEFFCESMDALPSPLARFYKKSATCAVAQYNLYENDALVAAVGFHSCTNGRLWNAQEKESLSLCAKLLGGFLLRIERPERIAGRDPLTGLSMWPRFRQRALRRLEGEDSWSLVVLDIVRFRDVNEMFSPAIGDKLLARLAQTLRRKLTEEELVCRLSAASTALLLHCGGGDVQDRLTDMKKSFIHVSRSLIGTQELTVAAGVVQASVGDDPATLLDKAKLACISSKLCGGACVVYDISLARQYQLRQTIRKNQQTALEDKEFALYLQPKYDSISQKITGAGAWVRWNTKTDGQLLNSQFLPVFRESGFVLDLDYELIDLICAALAAWPQECRVPISLRIDRLHFVMADFVMRLCAICEKHQVSPKLICLELQEDVFLGDAARRSQLLYALHNAGFLLMLSGFGQGWSSLDILTGSPLDILRLDDSFFSGEDENKRRIAGTICSMAHELGLTVTAEGVNTPHQADFLRSIGVDELQGDLFVPTLSAEQYFKDICCGK